MRRVALAVLFLFASVSSFADGGHIGNGAGIAEGNVLAAYNRLGEAIRECLLASVCGLDSQERDLLGRIKISLPEEKLNREQIQFRSEHQSPGFFVIDGQVRIAKTGNHIGDEIYFNVDLLYWRDPDGSSRALQMTQAAAILIHELGHHQGITDHRKLDVLGLKVARLMESFLTTFLIGSYRPTDFRNSARNVALLVMNPREESGFPYIAYLDGDRQKELSDNLRKSLMCDAANRSKLIGFRLVNLHLDRLPPDPQMRWIKRVRGDAELTCLYQNAIGFAVNQVLFDVSLVPDPQVPRGWMASLDRVEAIDCALRPNDCK